MKLIAHRGNTNGVLKSEENKPDYIDLAISKGYDVEIDVWYKDNTLWLGHDKPDYKVELEFIVCRISKLWIHCKNVDAINYFKECGYDINFFWHENDTITLTSQNYIWAYPGKQPIENSIAVMPEIYNDDILNVGGICSDYIIKYDPKLK
jgi:hypothetical protein